LLRPLRIILALVLLAAVGLCAAVLLYPLPRVLVDLRPHETEKVYDRDGSLLYEVLDQAQGRQTFLPLSEIPKPIVDAFLSAEDQSFYQNSGIDFPAILRSIWQNVSAGQIVSGGSTITQQLVRNAIGTNQSRTFAQKLKESLLALKVSRLHDKDQILELYLNSIYFGGLAYGVESASWQYFGKSAQNLDLAESAFLAGLPQAPNRYYPFKYFDAAKKRQEAVLAAMLKNGAIKDSEFQSAKEETLTLKPTKADKKAPHFVDYVLQGTQEESDVLNPNCKTDSGLPIADCGFQESNSRITTTLDLGLQENLENIVESQLTFLQQYHLSNAAAVVLDAKTGDLLAMVGSADYFDPSIQGAVNVATSLRQPGSALKPLLYATAFEKGWTPATVINDEPVRFDTQEGLPYDPKNYDLEYHGPVTVAQALAQSLNIPAVKTLDFVGIAPFLRKVQDFGITTLTESPEHYGLSLALGSGEVTLLELTDAYTAFANHGQWCPVRYLKTDGAPDCAKATSPEIAQTISSILSNNELRMPEFGEENPLHFDFPVAAKTGTSRDFRDNWTVGYTDDYAVGVWVGNANGDNMQGVSGIEGAAPLFNKVLNLLHEKYGTVLTVQNDERIPSTIDLNNGQGANGNSRLPDFRIISPFANDVYLYDPTKPADTQKIQLQASESAQWFVDDRPLGQGESVLWTLSPGAHMIRAVSGDETREVEINVQ
jgi:penicillin-binding protein 1C